MGVRAGGRAQSWGAPRLALPRPGATPKSESRDDGGREGPRGWGGKGGGEQGWRRARCAGVRGRRLARASSHGGSRLHGAHLVARRGQRRDAKTGGSVFWKGERGGVTKKQRCPPTPRPHPRPSLPCTEQKNAHSSHLLFTHTRRQRHTHTQTHTHTHTPLLTPAPAAALAAPAPRPRPPSWPGSSAAGPPPCPRPARTGRPGTACPA